jgi:LacI family transcriptional regulator
MTQADCQRENNRKPDMHAVARAAGVSISSVSRTINGDNRVHSRIQRKVWKAIEDLNYTPNPYARMLSSGITDMIGVIISADSASQFPGLLSSLEDAALDCRLGLRISSKTDSWKQVALSIQAMIEWKLRRVLLIINGEAIGAELLKSGIEMLQQQSTPTTALTICYRDGIRQAIQHLAVLGHRRITLIAFKTSAIVTSGLEQSFCRAMSEINAPPTVIQLEEASIQAYSRTLLKSMFDEWQQPSAILCATHREALFVLCVALELAIKIPEGLSIVCCDASTCLSSTRPSVTALEIDTEKLGAILKRLLIRPVRATGAQEKLETHRVLLRLAIRKSTALPVRMIHDLHPSRVNDGDRFDYTDTTLG